MFRALLVIIGISAALAGSASCARESYRRAGVDATGQLHIIASSGREIEPPTDSDQVGVDQVALSPDRRTVGWTVLYPNCCTSYPIPLKLVLLTHGRERTFTGNGLPIWQWSFSADGDRVAFRQAPAHGAASSHFELRETRTGRQVSSFDSDPDSVRGAPAWVRALLPAS